MTWVTKRRIKVNRAATAWLIRRFIDPGARVLFVEADDGYGPYGAKSIGESGICPAPAAIANAIFNATGRRMRDLPITRDRILGALA